MMTTEKQMNENRKAWDKSIQEEVKRIKYRKSMDYDYYFLSDKEAYEQEIDRQASLKQSFGGNE